MNFRRFASLTAPPLFASFALLMGACSSEEGNEEGTGDGDANTGGDGNVPPGGGGALDGTGGVAGPSGGAPSGTGATGGGSGGNPPGTGGDGSGTGGESPGTGGENAGTGGESGVVECPTDEEELFSFFATSHAALIRESGNPDGFGGDLGGLSGADAICQSIAEFSSPCQSNKTWRAFLSTSTEDAIDRIGTGPWHDRLGRLLANNLNELTSEDRPPNAHAEIINDFPNEDGVPNQFPDGEYVDNHQFITGSGTDGRLYTQQGTGAGATQCADDGGWSVAGATCNDWTTSEEVGCPRVGHSWPRSGGFLANWISVWNEGGCAPGGVLEDVGSGGPDGTRRIGSAGGYGGFYCFAVTGQ